MFTFTKHYKSTIIFQAFQFDGLEENVPEWCSVKGIKLPVVFREVKFYCKKLDSHQRASYGDWIIYVDDNEKYWMPDEVFKGLFSAAP
jgi:hypothetical protein